MIPLSLEAVTLRFWFPRTVIILLCEAGIFVGKQQWTQGVTMVLKLWFQCRLASRNRSLIWLQAIACNFSLMALVFFSLIQISWSLNFVYFPINSLNTKTQLYFQLILTAFSPLCTFYLTFMGIQLNTFETLILSLYLESILDIFYFDLSMLSCKYILFLIWSSVHQFPHISAYFCF